MRLFGTVKKPEESRHEHDWVCFKTCQIMGSHYYVKTNWRVCRVCNIREKQICPLGDDAGSWKQCDAVDFLKALMIWRKAAIQTRIEEEQLKQRNDKAEAKIQKMLMADNYDWNKVVNGL